MYNEIKIIISKIVNPSVKGDKYEFQSFIFDCFIITLIFASIIEL